MSTPCLGLLAVAPLFCCAVDSPDPATRADALWEAVADRHAWSVVPHAHDVRIYAEDLAAVDGRDLTTTVPAGTLVACEQYASGELLFVEAFERTEDDVRRCIQLAHKKAFRVVEFSVQSNHVHLLIEAEDRRALGRGMQGLKIRMARRLNSLFGRKGTVFTDRYHARPITSPRQAKHCLQYVLNNARKHAGQQGRMPARNWIDPFSSAPTFDGWSGATVTSDGATEPGITMPAEFWLLRSAWRRYGPLDPNAVPGPAG